MALAVCGVVLAGLALSPGVMIWGVRKPNLYVLGRFLGWLALDLAALATALWAVLPAGGPAVWDVMPMFLMALGVGVASGSPGGVGPFEATLLACLPQVEAGALVAAIIAYRALAYGVPALCGALWAVVGRSDGGVMSLPADQRPLTPEALRALPSAEAQLIRQGALTLLAGQGGWVWLGGTLAHTRVLMGPVMAAGRVPRLAALQAVTALARSEARCLCLYKIDARMAAVARRRGHAVLPIAREAVLDPARFTEAGPKRARLRRKLSHARKAGVAVAEVTTLPEVEMAAVVADWAAVHGRERGFSMGRWEAAYVAGQRVVVARSAAGVLLAFITLHEGAGEWVLDLVRFRPGTPDGTTYAMVCCALDLARGAGVRRLSLAAVPEAAFAVSGGPSGPVFAPVAGLTARILHRAAQGSTGLAQFKSAFAPKWERRYVAAPSRTALVLGCLDLARAILRPGALHPGRARLVLHQGGGARGDGLPAERAA